MAYQEAIRFTFSIGIKHIWIDTLCIIQDDPLDWREQTGHLASIYQNFYITLAATSSRNSESGCFRDSDALTSYERALQIEAGQLLVQTPVKHWERP
jgi:heterokaryon incompatibility protein (HET)